MIPAGVDITDLAQQLHEDGVAYTNPIHGQDVDLNADVAKGLKDGDGIAAVDVAANRAPDVRDIAQELQDATGLDTVVVQTPQYVSSVSDTYSRADIEAVQSHLAPGLAQNELLNQYYAGLDQISFPVSATVGSVTLIAAIIFVSSYWAAVRR